MNRPFRDWRAQRVWIVGASSGIGAALAQALLARGARVALSARRADALAQLAGTAVKNEAALVLPLDLGDTAAFASALDRMVRDWGGIDLVVFCAGTWAPMAAGQLDAAAITHTLAVNLQAPMTACATLVPKLLAQGQGAIAFVSSVAGYRGLRHEQGGLEPLRRNPAPRTRTPWHFGVPDQPRLRRHADDGNQCLPHAGADHP